VRIVGGKFLFLEWVELTSSLFQVECLRLDYCYLFLFFSNEMEKTVEFVVSGKLFGFLDSISQAPHKNTKDSQHN
jgi:hypothetical protein